MDFTPMFPRYQSSNSVEDVPQTVVGVKVRNTTMIDDDVLGKKKIIVNLDLTTDNRIESVRETIQHVIDNGIAPEFDEFGNCTNMVKERNLSYNILPRFNSEDDFTGRFIPQAGELVKVQLKEVDVVDKDSGEILRKSIVVDNVFPMPTTSTKKTALFTDAMNAAIAAKAEPVIEEPVGTTTTSSKKRR